MPRTFFFIELSIMIRLGLVLVIVFTAVIVIHGGNPELIGRVVQAAKRDGNTTVLVVPGEGAEVAFSPPPPPPDPFERRGDCWTGDGSTGYLQLADFLARHSGEVLSFALRTSGNLVLAQIGPETAVVASRIGTPGDGLRLREMTRAEFDVGYRTTHSGSGKAWGRMNQQRRPLKPLGIFYPNFNAHLLSNDPP